MQERSDPERDRRMEDEDRREHDVAEAQNVDDAGYSYGGFAGESEHPAAGGYAQQGFGAGETGNPWGGGTRGGYGGGRPGGAYEPRGGGWSADLSEQQRLNPAYGERGTTRGDEPRESHWRGGDTRSGYLSRGGGPEEGQRGGQGRMGPDPRAGWGETHGPARPERPDQRTFDGPEQYDRGREWGGSNRQSAARPRHVYEYDRYEGRGGVSGPWTEPEPWAIPGPYTGVGPEGYRRPGQSIFEEVCERLTRHGGVDASGITVRVEENEVILEGVVESRAAKRLAEDAAGSVSGVRDVHNRLRVRDPE